jgi:hypothetical protein
MTPTSLQQSITIRRLRERDELAVSRLAELDSAAVPAGRLLGAEIDGVLLAAISVETEALIADPFRRTIEATDLLRARVQQLRHPRIRRRLRAGRRGSRAALAGSPPGAGGRLLDLGG